jgi:hypothetical protein
MSSKTTLLLASVSVAAALLSAAGCKKATSGTSSGESASGDSDASPGARDYFITKVYPSISRTCGNCHEGQSKGSVFLTSTAEESYTKISTTIGLIAEPSKSPLVQHQHTDTTIVLSPEQRTLLTQWLNLEATARGLEGAVQKAPTLQQAYQDYANCMNYDIWTYYRMGDLPFTQTDNDGPCMGCHTTGQGSAFLAADARLTFEKAKTFPFIQKFVVGKLDAQGNFDSLIPAGRFVEKANEPCPDGSTTCHPSFGLPPNVANALDLFVTTTLQNIAAGTCNQPFTPPKDAGPPDAADGGAR